MSGAETSARPRQPTSEAELQRSIRVIRIAILSSVVTIIGLTLAFTVALDAPAFPLVAIAGFVVVFDLVFLAAFTRQRKQAIATLRVEPAPRESHPRDPAA
jgi:hypothetical protein